VNNVKEILDEDWEFLKGYIAAQKNFIEVPERIEQILERY